MTRILRIAAVVIACMLLVRFAWDMSSRMHPLIGIPAAMLSAGAIAACVLALRPTQPGRDVPDDRRFRFLFTIAIPFSFFASSLDCAGLDLEGCAFVCTVLKLTVIPVLATMAIVHAVRPRAWLPPAMLGVAFVTLFPHCICRNPVNAWWMDLFGSSPMCFGWGFFGTVMCVTALEGRGRRWLSLAVTYASSLGTTGFFIGHHYFHFPW